jgi:hypothetical protein
MNQVKIFLSHSSKDKDFVRRLHNELKGFRHDVWIDENEISVGDSIFTEIEKGLNKSDYVIIVLSRNFNLSKWARAELEATFHLETKYDKKLILPCLIEDTEIPLLIATRKYADFREDFTSGLFEIIKTITPKEKEEEMDVYIKNSLVVLDILDTEGKKVKYIKTATHVSLIDNNTHYIDCISADGEIEEITDHIGKITRFYHESGMNFFEWNYDRVLMKGDSHERKLTATINNGFTNNEEYWETISNNHNTDKFVVIVKFPDKRKPKNWYMEERFGTKYLGRTKETIKTNIIDDKFCLILTVETPQIHRAYVLRWEW